MTDPLATPSVPRVYSAFISYRHLPEDRRWAKWLFEAIETYRTPASLRKQGYPKRIRKLFRDEEETPASTDLSRQIEEALCASDYLIVVCSPDTGRSRWVCEEIRRFQELGRGDRILALLIAGEPSESFPEILLKSADGLPREPIAADVRPRRDLGEREIKRRALLRILAGLLGCGLDDLMQREYARSARRMRRIVGLSLAMVVSLSGLSWYAFQQRNSALEAEELANRQVRRLQSLSTAIPSKAISDKATEAYHSWAQEGGFRKGLSPPDFTSHLRLARQAVLATLEQDDYVTTEAFEALLLAIQRTPPWGGTIHLNDDDRPMAISWSRDGRYLATSSEGGNVAIRDGTTYELMAETTIDPVRGQPYTGQTIAWCSAENFILAGEGIRQPRWFDVRSLGSSKVLGDSDASAAACDAPGNRIALREKDRLVVIDRGGDSLAVLELPPDSLGFAWSPSSEWISFLDGPSLKLTDLHGQVLTAPLRGGTFATRWDGIDDELLAVAVQYTEGATGRYRLVFTRFRPEHGMLGVVGDPVESGYKESQTGYPPANVIQISPDLDWVAVGTGLCNTGMQGSSCEEVSVQIWNSGTGRLVREMYGHTGEPNVLSWHPGGGILASGTYAEGGVDTRGDHRILIWKPEPLWNVNGWEDGYVLRQEGWTGYGDKGWLGAARWDDDGDVVVANTDSDCTACLYQSEGLSVGVWDVISRRWSHPEGRKVNLDEVLPHIVRESGGIHDSLTSPDGTREISWLADIEDLDMDYEEAERLMRGLDNRIAMILDPGTHAGISLVGHESPVGYAAWSHDASTVLTLSRGEAVRMWDARTGRELARYSLERDTVTRVAWRPDGKWMLVHFVSNPGVYIYPTDIREMLAQADRLLSNFKK